MSVVACLEGLISGHPGSLPAGAALEETVDSCRWMGVMVEVRRNQMGDGIAVASNGDCLAALYGLEQLSEPCLGLCSFNFSHACLF